MIKRLLTILICISFPVVVISQEIQRIVSLAPSLTKNIYLLECQDKLVGCTNYCFVANEDNKEIVASAIDVNIEKVLTLTPDIVIATTITQPDVIQTFEKVGIKVLIYSSPKSFEEICSQFIEMGELLNKKSFAESLIEREKDKIIRLQKRISATEKKTTMFFELGAKPLFTVIPNTFMNDYITFAGCKNIASDMIRGSITRESVIVRNPDIIFIVTMGILGEEEKSIWANYTGLSATKNEQIFIIDSDMACSPTPVSFSNTVEQIINYLYPNTNQ